MSDDARLLDVERELRRRQRAHARAGRRRDRRLGRATALGLALVAIAAFAVAKGLPALGVGHRTAGNRRTHAAAAVERRPAHAGAPAASPAAAAARVPARSPLGLPLGRPPLQLRFGDGGDTVHAVFRHPPRAGLLFDLSNGRVLWQLDPLARLHIASLTKMMTVLRVVRDSSPGEGVPITRQAADAPGSKVGVLPVGRTVSLRTLLYGLMLPSGNDAAIALAQHVAGSVGAFVRGMNEEAARLGLGCTRFSSPSGYYNVNDYSCAADLAVLAHVDLGQPLIARVAGSASAVLPLPIKGGKVYLYNNNPLLVYGYPGATGLKTGYTESAGDCLVGTAERDGIRLGVVLLHSPELGRQAERLLDKGFAAYGLPRIPAPPVPPGR